MSLNAPPWGGPAVTRAAGGGSSAAHWQTRRNPAAQSYGTGTQT